MRRGSLSPTNWEWYPPVDGPVPRHDYWTHVGHARPLARAAPGPKVDAYLSASDEAAGSSPASGAFFFCFCWPRAGHVDEARREHVVGGLGALEALDVAGEDRVGDEVGELVTDKLRRPPTTQRFTST